MSSSTCAAKPADNESKTVEITAFANLGHESERYEACSDAEEHRRHMVEIQRSAGQETSKAAEADRMPCSSSNCPICRYCSRPPTSLHITYVPPNSTGRADYSRYLAIVEQCSKHERSRGHH